MKRSEALAILSRDHHQALVVAQQLTRAGADTARAAQARFLNYWHPGGLRHFQLEEDLLFPAYAAYADAYEPLLLRALGDHVAIRAQAAQVGQTPPSPLETLHTLGKGLAAHVRLEERELFPMIEAAMPADELLELARRLERAGASDAAGRTVPA